MNKRDILKMRLKQIRERSGINQKEIATKIGVTPMTIHRWESLKQDNIPDIMELQAFAEACDVNVGEFFGDGDAVSGNEKSPPAQEPNGQSLPIYEYSGLKKFGLNDATSKRKLLISSNVILSGDGEMDGFFAISQDESFRLGKYGFTQDVQIVVIDPVQEIVEDGKIYLVFYNGSTYLRRVMRIPGGGYSISNDDGTDDITPLLAESGKFTILGKVVWFVVKK